MLLPLLFLSLTSWANSLTPAPASKINITLPYTMGEHELKAKGLTGTLEWDGENKEIKSGELKLPITAIQAEKDELECHMREALGLDYKVSDFPETHVCEDDELPEQGPNSIRYPHITASLLSPLKLGKNQVPVKWNIHGKEKVITMPITLEMKEGKMTLKSKWKMKLSDFDITVKKFLFIGVEDEASLKTNISFR